MQIAIIVIGIVITIYLGIKEKRKNEENINIRRNGKYLKKEKNEIMDGRR